MSLVTLNNDKHDFRVENIENDLSILNLLFWNGLLRFSIKVFIFLDSSFERRKIEERNPDNVEEKILYRYEATSVAWNDNLIIAGGYYMNFGEDTNPRCKNPVKWGQGQVAIREVMLLHRSDKASKDCGRSANFIFCKNDQ